MKKRLFILFLLIVCSGCSATYEINIQDNKIHEKINIIETNTSLFDAQFDDGETLKKKFNDMTLDNEFVKINGSLKHINKASKIGIEYKNKIDIKKYYQSSIFNQCYENPTFEITDEYFYADSGVYFNCYEYYDYLDDIKIILKTNHKVLDHNADEVKNGKYIWNITKSNYEDKNIEIKLSMTEYKKNYTPLIIIICAVATTIIIGIIILSILMKKMQKRNDF